MSRLALFGGEKTVTEDHESMFHWPIVTEEDEAAVLEVLQKGLMSGTEITKKFEKAMAEWLGVKYALGYCNGTSGILGALWACGVGAGDEVICPSMTYWASAGPVQTLGGVLNFADIERDTLCIDPNDIEHRIGPRTKVIIVVHYAGHPCNMDKINEIAKRHNLLVLEDASHAQGSLYHGKKCGTLGDVSVMSLMTAKSFAIGEAGMLFTNNRNIFEKAMAYGFYERTGAVSEFFKSDNQITNTDLIKYAGAPLGGFKHRMHQMSSAVGLVQLKYFDERSAENDRAMKYFWSQLEDIKQIKPHMVKEEGSTMGGWYYPLGYFVDSKSYEEGTLAKICKALTAEGVPSCSPAKNKALHLHPVFNELDLFRVGKPTAICWADRDVRQGKGACPNSEDVQNYVFSVPWFKHMDKEIINQYVKAFHKVFSHLDEILK